MFVSAMAATECGSATLPAKIIQILVSTISVAFKIPQDTICDAVSDAAHGLPAAALHTVTRATTIARLLYASPAWWGFTIEKDRARLDKLYTRIKRMDYLPDNAPTFPSLVGKADERLFRSIELNPSHVLRDLLPPKAKRPYKL